MRAGKAGFTLIEVMVALLILASGMLAAILSVSQAASNGGYLRERTMAHWIAMNRLTEARLQKNAPPISKTSDEVEMAGRKWKWTMNVTQTQVETMRRIDVEVRPVEAPENSRLASITGFYGSAVAPPGSALVAWQGTDSGPQQPGDKDKDKEDEQQGQPNPPGNDDEDPGPPPEPDDPQDGIDPSDPTQ
jgi:general secretion pathway protein I